MKRKARITRLIITALIVSLAAILTALSPIKPKGDALAGQHEVRCSRQLRKCSTP
jgi:hypothetical protein